MSSRSIRMLAHHNSKGRVLEVVWVAEILEIVFDEVEAREIEVPCRNANLLHFGMSFL
ncbi:hypothetical protein [Haladaptatus halobius]|uniref:hypothetical protein n=1 Tax=Haladaptatus halobius TaxID=2884875 RepID=UPI001D0AC9CA|nr:hypothetical protein [Haladaptatus halobius]